MIIVVGFLLLIGFLTRFVALVTAIVGVSCVFSWPPASRDGPLGIPVTATLAVVIAIALICLARALFLSTHDSSDAGRSLFPPLRPGHDEQPG